MSSSTGSSQGIRTSYNVRVRIGVFAITATIDKPVDMALKEIKVEMVTRTSTKTV